MLSQSKIFKRITSGNATRSDKQWLELLWNVLSEKDIDKLLLHGEFKELNSLVALHLKLKEKH